MKKNKILISLIVFVIICIILLIVYEIIHIYAVFQSDVSGDVSFTNGVWHILVNETEISTAQEKSFTIDKINLENSQNVKEGKLAPGTTGNFQIAIDPQNTNVSIRYDISLNAQGLTNKNIKIRNITKENSDEGLINTGDGIYTGIITLDEIKNNKIDNIKVEIEWINSEDNNTEDTELGSVYDSTFNIPITIKFTQYLGENII